MFTHIVSARLFGEELQLGYHAAVDNSTRPVNTEGICLNCNLSVLQ